MKKSLISMTLAIAGIAATASVQAQTTYKMTIASGQAAVFPYIGMLRDYFIPEIDRRLASTPYRIQWTQGFGGTIMKIGSEVESIRDGLVDIGFVLVANNESKLPLHTFTYFTPFSSSDSAVVASAFNETQQSVASFNEVWDRNNQVYLSAAAIGGYNIYSKKPLRSIEDFKGLKVGVIGPNANWLRNTGAVSVTLNLPSISNDLKAGIYDAALLADSVAASLKIQEVGPYRIQYDVGSVIFCTLTINKTKWNSLPPQVREVIGAVARDWGREVTAEMTKRGKEGVETMLKAGLTNIDPGPAGRAEWAKLMPNIAQEWVTSRGDRAQAARAVIPAYLKSVEAQGGKPLRDWSK